MITRQHIQAMYQEGAKHYDLVTMLFRMMGLRMQTYRRTAIDTLSLKPGDVVLELGCGTGLNFPYILEKIGPEGRLIAVDLTPGMLAVAHQRVERHRWRNVDLVEADVIGYDIPTRVNAVLMTGLLGYIPEYDRLLFRVADSLVPGGRLAILDGKAPTSLPSWLLSLVMRVGSRFGYTPDYFSVRPWESVQRYFDRMVLEERYGGMIYILSAVAPAVPGRKLRES